MKQRCVEDTGKLDPSGKGRTKERSTWEGISLQVKDRNGKELREPDRKIHEEAESSGRGDHAIAEYKITFTEGKICLDQLKTSAACL
ncbi:hypothetical protein Tco_0926362 [Tanacetum coccineum]|uniref:Uncharacterized protein n=1 Tax=Tanacetum coccineum TaxID=301880 RepID=A0ABQ5DBK1_9ASTR